MTRQHSSLIEFKEMFSLSELLQVPSTTCLLLMTDPSINGEILKLDSTHSKSQEIIGLLNLQAQDYGQSSQPPTRINFCSVSRMRATDKNLILEPIHLLKIEIDG
jgi:hypothetical protein